MKPKNIFDEELRERFHRVPLDGPEPCLGCGRGCTGGLYLANQLRPLCTTCHTLFTQSEHGQRLDEALRIFNDLGPRALTGRELQQHAARQLADWLVLRRAERLNRRVATDPGCSFQSCLPGQCEHERV